MTRNGVAQVAVNNVVVDTVAKTVTLTLGTNVLNADAVTVSYTPGTNKTSDIAGNSAVALVNQGVTPPGVDDPTIYHQRSGGIVLPRSADWWEATQPLREKFERIAKRRGRKIAKVAVARQILTLCYYGLRDGEIRCLTERAA